MPTVGDAVIFVDERRKQHCALVTEVHGTDEAPSVNLLYVSDDENERDNYGRQIKRQSSVVHDDDQSGGGNCWMVL